MADEVVIGRRDLYRFAEEPIPQRSQVTVLDTPKVATELPAPARIDPDLKEFRIAMEQALAQRPFSPLQYVPRRPTRWFRVSPFELFMEKVLGPRLWTLE